jgi:hypothetical protein
MNAEQGGALRENSGSYEACLEIIEREAGLLAELIPVQEAVSQAVIRREWDRFEASVGFLGELSGRFEELEAERARIFAALPGAAGGEERFYALVSRFPPEKRREIGARYRELKRESFRLRMVNTSLLEYLNEAKAAVGAFLESVLPKRAGPAYSRLGTRVPQDMRSMMLNASF